MVKKTVVARLLILCVALTSGGRVWGPTTEPTESKIGPIGSEQDKVGQDFWALKSVEGSIKLFVVAVRLPLDASTLTPEGAELTLQGFRKLFHSSGCTVEDITMDGDQANMTLIRPNVSHSCLSFPSAVVGSEQQRLAISLEITDITQRGAETVLDPALPGRDWGKDEPLHANCNTMVCEAFEIANDVHAILQQLDEKALDQLAQHLAQHNRSQSLLENGKAYADEFIGQCKPNQPCYDVLTTQNLAAASGARVALAGLFHVLERTEFKKQAVAQAQVQRSWGSVFSKFPVPTWQNVYQGLGWQAARPAMFGVAYPILRDRFHKMLHSPQEEKGVDSAVLGSTVATFGLHPAIVLGARAAVGAEQPYRYLHRGLMPSATSAFIWGAGYGAMQNLLTAALGPQRAESAKFGIDVMAGATGIFLSAPLDHVAYTQMLAEPHTVPASSRKILQDFLTETLQSKHPLRTMLTKLNMHQRLLWGVPRFSLTMLAMRSLYTFPEDQLE